MFLGEYALKFSLPHPEPTCYNWRMCIIEIDDQTAKEIQNAAQAQGVSVAEFVRMRVLGKDTVKNGKQTDDFDFESELKGLLTSGPTLPADFSRADIYTDE